MVTNILVGRETKSDYLFNVFFGTAILTVLAIRAFLAITNYPQLGGDGLHIAHMLWGGLFMLISLVVLLYFHGFRVKFLAAFMAGIGFGFFIDELGKFITSDNDYFYRPTAMLIYVVFVLMWGMFAWLAKYVAVTPQENAVDVFSKLRDSMIYGLSASDTEQIEKQLRIAGLSTSDAHDLLKITTKMSPQYDANSPWQKLNKLAQKIQNTFDKIASYNRTKHILLAIFLVQAAAAFIVAGLLVFVDNSDVAIFDIPSSTPAFVLYGLLLCLVATIVCVFVGFVYFVRMRSRQVFVWYRRALLVNIFGTQVFLFYTNQFQAAFGLIFNLLLFAFVNELAYHQTEDYRKIKQ